MFLPHILAGSAGGTEAPPARQDHSIRFRFERRMSASRSRLESPPSVTLREFCQDLIQRGAIAVRSNDEPTSPDLSSKTV